MFYGGISGSQHRPILIEGVEGFFKTKFTSDNLHTHNPDRFIETTRMLGCPSLRVITLGMREVQSLADIMSSDY